MDHLDLTTLDRHARGVLGPAEKEAVDAHAAGCAPCGKLLAALREGSPTTGITANTSPAPAVPAARRETDEAEAADEVPLPAGTLVDRYVVLHKVGAGGMGVVYAAYDPQLDRKVALKLLRRVPGMDGALAQARLLREAQAVARLSHPNVVSVYDAGRHGDQVFVALELLEGQHLRAWLRERPRPWRAILEVALAAGRGLEAAHAAGLVHRDFKPENVLVGADQRARVVDFGLVGPARDSEERLPELAAPASPVASGTLTQAGAVLGTPGYMAPEQLQGQRSDARTDQFAFAVTVVESLTGKRPLSCDVPPAPPGVPGAVMRVLTRGLLEDPARRFASMGELLGALGLAAGARTRRRAAALVAAATVLLLLGGGIGLQRRDQVCRGGGERFATAWDQARAEAVRGAFHATGSPLATDAWLAVQRFMGEYRRDWVAAYADACEATYERREQPENVLGLRMACLERRRREVQALGAIFTRADRDVVLRAGQATAELSSLSACEDVERLLAQVQPPDDASSRQEVERIQGALAEVKALLDVARYREGEARAAQLVDQATTLGYAPVLAAALSLYGDLLVRTGQPGLAGSVLAQAMREAEVARDHALATEVSARLARLLVSSTQYAQVPYWIERGQVVLARGGSSPLHPLLQAQLLEARAALLSAQGRHERAVPLLRESLSWKEQALGTSHLAVTGTLDLLTRALLAPAEQPESLEHARRALEIRKQSHGPGHPEVARAMQQLGAVYRRMDRHEEERELAGRALEIYRAALGDDHLDVARARWYLANAHEFMGDLRGALEQWRLALPVMTRAYGPENLQVGTLIESIAKIEILLGNLDAAIEGCRRAIQIQERALPPGDPKLNGGWLCLGTALTLKGRLDDAEAALARAERLARPVDQELAPVLESQARLWLRRGRPAETLAHLARADRLMRPWSSDDSTETVPRKLLNARALDALGRKEEAFITARRALDILEAVPSPHRLELDEARQLVKELRRTAR